MTNKYTKARENLKLALAGDSKAINEIWGGYLKHIVSGYSLDCFAPASEKSLELLSKTYPEQCPWEDIILAQREAKTFWEGIGQHQSTGKCLGNSRSWYYNMSHRYGWTDKLDIKAEHSGTVSVNLVQYAQPTQPVLE